MPPSLVEAAPKRDSLALNNHNLAQCMRHFDQVFLGFHDLIDGLIGRRRFVQHPHIFTALNPVQSLHMLLERDAFFRLGSGHDTPRSVGAGTEAVFVPQTAQLR